MGSSGTQRTITTTAIIRATNGRTAQDARPNFNDSLPQQVVASTLMI